VGTVLSYTGATTAIKIQGHLAGLEHLTVLGTVSALGSGIEIDGDAHAVESWFLRHVLIYGFTGGTALYLNARNAGSIAYGLCEGVRVRNAKTGIHIYDVGGAGGFANTNQFIGGAISGASGFDYGLRIEGGNDNRFFGMSVEPYTSTYGHIVVENGSLVFDGRIEGVSQPATTPLIDVRSGADDGTYIRGTGASGLVKNAVPYFARIEMVSGKHAEPRLSPRNLFRNAPLVGADLAARTVPEWTVTETGGASTWMRGAAEIADGHVVLGITVPASGSVELKPTTNPYRYDTAASTATFGLWVKTSTPSAAYARINGLGGVTTGGYHSGSGLWEPVSMSQHVAAAAQPDARFVLGNATGAPVTFYLTAPYFTFGTVSPETVAVLPVAGGVMSGAVEGGGGTATIPAAGDDEWYTSATSRLTVPKWNTIHVAGTARTIARLNDLAANRYAKYSLVRVIFDIASVGVTDGAYINLDSAYTSTVSGWLLLEANGDGTWTERDRK
jgi:hypothetical protein